MIRAIWVLSSERLYGSSYLSVVFVLVRPMVHVMLLMAKIYILLLVTWFFFRLRDIARVLDNACARVILFFSSLLTFATMIIIIYYSLWTLWVQYDSVAGTRDQRVKLKACAFWISVTMCVGCASYRLAHRYEYNRHIEWPG